jgi:hypothetical protein
MSQVKNYFSENVAPCRLVEVDRRFRGVSCLRRQGYGDGGKKRLETTVYLYQTTRCNIPEDSHLQIRRHHIPFKEEVCEGVLHLLKGISDTGLKMKAACSSVTASRHSIKPKKTNIDKEHFSVITAVQQDTSSDTNSESTASLATFLK